MADASPVTIEQVAEPAAERGKEQPGTLGAVPATGAPVAVEDLDDLVEDVSIDGMCGVY